MSENDETETKIPEEPQRIHLHVYLEHPLTVNVNIHTHHYHGPPQPGPAVMAMTRIGGKIMGTSAPATPPQISVDEQNKEADVKWVDSHGDTDAAAPPNAQVVWSGDDDSVAMVDADTGKITPVVEGQFTLSVAFNDSSTGGSLMLPDGVTPFPVPEPTQIQVVAGAAVGAELEIETVDTVS